MRAILSFVRTTLIGLACFATFTAALCIALSIAIAGPPTAAEMAGARELLAELSRALGDGMRRGRDDGCGSGSVCADAERYQVEMAEAQPAEVTPPRSAAEIAVAVEEPRADPSELLGPGDVAVAPARVDRVQPPRPRAERRASVADHRRPAPRPRIAPRRSPPPPPLRSPSQGRTETLPAATDADSLAEIRSAPEARLRHPEPYQDEQQAYEAEEWEDEPYDEEDSYEDPPYEDDYERDPYDETW